MIEQWRWEYNTKRPHSSLEYRTPAEVGAEAPAKMHSESRPSEIVVPVASSEAEVGAVHVETHPIMPAELS